WRDSAKAKDVATAMKITAQDLVQLGIVDTIVKEPVGGAHRDPAVVMERAAEAIRGAFSELSSMSGEELRKARRDKFLAIGRNLG
ncbi:MAG: acetyl-CoA carboxylase carboxyl transferase subunit alpha, partial [Nitratireductor sp.]